MLLEVFQELYDNFKFNFYNSIFKEPDDPKEDLTIIEVFCVEAIYSLERPTISELSNFMKVSRQNMSYRISQLEEKGYVHRVQSKLDKREYFLEVTDKFEKLETIKNEYIVEVFKRVEEYYSEEELQLIYDILQSMTTELMPEIGEIKNQLRHNKESS